MGVGEGDFHRTRLTHSIEVGQIGEGILLKLLNRHANEPEILSWLPNRSLVDAACCAHDLGHPPYGHGGERALQQCMLCHGGFEGNAQTLRILVKLEKYWQYRGLNPTRRTILSVLKYPVCYEDYDEHSYRQHPPKCYYATEQNLIEWVLEPFSSGDRRLLVARNAKDKPLHRSLDASLMECADDIAYAVHDLEDVVARGLVTRLDLENRLDDMFPERQIGALEKGVMRDSFVSSLFDKGSTYRKQYIGRLVNLFVTEAKIQSLEQFEHPLLRLRVGFDNDSNIVHFVGQLKAMTYDLVVNQAAVRQLERRGQRVIQCLYNEFNLSPESLIPTAAWENLDPSDTKERRVCDYIAGMTDPYAEKIYHQLFTPGTGTSRDEL